MSEPPAAANVRTYAADGRRRRAACLCIRPRSDQAEGVHASSPPWRQPAAGQLGLDVRPESQASPAIDTGVDAEVEALRVAVAAGCDAPCAWEILLLSSTLIPEPGLWILPGGGIEPHEEPCVAAAREAYEEAGAQGPVVFLCDVATEAHTTSMFLMRVVEMLDRYPEQTERQREWVPLEAAPTRLALKERQLLALQLSQEAWRRMSDAAHGAGGGEDAKLHPTVRFSSSPGTSL